MVKTNNNLNISADSQLICTKHSDQGSFFEADQSESQKCYATIETDKKFNISADSQPICTDLSEQASFFQAG